MIPWVTIGLTLCVLGIHGVPGAASLLQWQSGTEDIWRGLTCHLTHWDGPHLAWDLLVFAGFACYVESSRRIVMVWLLAGCAGLIALVLNLGMMPFDAYRGLSGLDTSLFVVVAMSAIQSSDKRQRVLAQIAWLGLLVKLGLEWLGSDPIFVQSASFEPAPLAHAVGAFWGLLMGLATSKSEAAVSPARICSLAEDDRSVMSGHPVYKM